MSRLFTNQFDAVTVAPSSSINNLQTYTAMAWVLANTWGGQLEGVIFSKDNGLDIDPVDNIQLELGNSNGIDERGIETFFAFSGFSIAMDPAGSYAVNNLISLGQWVHLAMVVNGPGQVRLYRNGVEQAYQYQEPIVSFGDDSASPWVIGNYLDGSFEYNFQGLLAEVRLYTSLLTPAQIQEAMNGGSPSPETLVTYLSFRANLGSPEPDASGHGNVGVISGATFNSSEPPPFSSKNPLPIPFSKRTTAAVAVFACLAIAAPQQYDTPASFGAAQFATDALTIAALQIEYAQLLHEYHMLRHQDTANNRADLYAAIDAAVVTVGNLKETVDGLTTSTDRQIVLANMQNRVAQALTNLLAAQSEE